MAQPQNLSLSSIVSHCNVGAHFIDTGNYGDAVAYLRVGFQAARRELRCKPYDEQAHLERMEHQNHWVSFSLDQYMVKETTITKHCNCYGEGDSSSTFIYSHPIHIPVPKTETTESLHPQNKLAILSGVLFNLALCHQLEAMRCEVDDPNRLLWLTKAAKLYESIFRLVQIGTNDVQDSSYFLMAALNNVGVAYQSLNRPEIAGLYLRRLVSMMMVLINSNQYNRISVHNHHGYYSSSVFECFFLNTYQLIMSDGSCAAPAA